MKKHPIIFPILLLSFIALSACKTHTSKTAVTTQPQTPLQAETPKNDPLKSNTAKHTYRFIVSFISKGGGIDNIAYKRLKDHLAARTTLIAVDEIAWGREGEMDLGFDLKELSTTEQTEFITQVKALLKDSELVQYTENAVSLNARD